MHVSHRACPGTLTWPEGRIDFNSKGSRFVNNGALQMLGNHMFYRHYSLDRSGGVALAVTNSASGTMVTRVELVSVELLLTCCSCFAVLQTLGGSLTFSDTSLSHSGTFVASGAGAAVVLENYYHPSSGNTYYHSDANTLDLLPGSSFSLLENATLRNQARSRNGLPGLIRVHGDVLSADGSATRLESVFGTTEFVESSFLSPSRTVLSGGHLRFTSSSTTTIANVLEMASDSSYLRGTGDVVVSGSLLWTRGRMDGSGTTTITGSLQLEPPSATSYVYLQDTRALVNNGAVA